MRREDLETVSKLPLFRGLGSAELQQLFQAAFLQRFPQGVLLARQGARADFLHGVTTGSVELFATYAEAEATICVLRPGTAFMLGAVVDDEPLIHSARTLEAAQILMVPAEPVRQLLRRDSVFAAAVAKALAGEVRATSRDLQSHKLRTSLERLASWILTTQRERGGASGIVLPFQKRTLASLIGTSPENLSRNFQALADHGVTVRGNRMIISDMDRVVALARPAPELDDIPACELH